MSGKSNVNSIFKTVTTDILITVMTFIVLIMIIASLVDAAAISVKAANVMVLLSVMLSCILSFVLTTVLVGKNIKAVIISIAVLVALSVAIPLCQKGSGVNVNRVIITTAMIAVSKFIPSVIKRGRERTNVRRKRKKR